MIDLTAALGATGVRALVSGRAEGNMGFTGAPDPEAVRGARRRFLEAAGMEAEAAVAVRQVHGSVVLRAGPGERGRGGLDPESLLGDADGILTTEPGLPILALAADCCVGVLAVPGGRGAALFHAGWRGALAGTPAAAARALEDAVGVPGSSLRAVLGPAIGPCCYEVGEEVGSSFRDRFGPRAGAWLVPGRNASPRLDLPGAVRAGLLEAGLSPEAVAPAGPCTLCGRGWFSHRRGDRERQMVAVVLS